VHVEAPSADAVPAVQATHVDTDVAPVTLEAVPAGQDVHDEAVPAAEYVPAPHVLQLDAPSSE